MHICVGFNPDTWNTTASKVEGHNSGYSGLSRPLSFVMVPLFEPIRDLTLQASSNKNSWSKRPMDIRKKSPWCRATVSASPGCQEVRSTPRPSRGFPRRSSPGLQSRSETPQRRASFPPHWKTWPFRKVFQVFFRMFPESWVVDEAIPDWKSISWQFIFPDRIDGGLCWIWGSLDLEHTNTRQKH